MATVGQRVSEAEATLSVHCNISACFQHLFFGIVRIVQSDMKVLAKIPVCSIMAITFGCKMSSSSLKSFHLGSRHGGL